VSDNEKKMAELTDKLKTYLPELETYTVSVGDKTDHKRPGLGEEIEKYAEFIKSEYINLKPEDLKQSDSINGKIAEDIAFLIEHLDNDDTSVKDNADNNVSQEDVGDTLNQEKDGDEKSLYDLVLEAIGERTDMDSYNGLIKRIQITITNLDDNYDFKKLLAVPMQTYINNFNTSDECSKTSGHIIDLWSKILNIFDMVSTDDSMTISKMSSFIQYIGVIFKITQKRYTETYVDDGSSDDW
jgi:hypothetical protein